MITGYEIAIGIWALNIVLIALIYLVNQID